ncbi:MAG: polysaccharide biosynthesis/export family protein [Planctomycetota bacterium]|jgi:protein involved in polysaccharide export with SLBB domain
MSIFRERKSLVLPAFLILGICICAGCLSPSEGPNFRIGQTLPGPLIRPIAFEPEPEPELEPDDPFFHNPPEGVIQRLQPGDEYTFRIIDTSIESNVSVSLTGTVEIPEPLFTGQGEYIADHFRDVFVQGKSPEEFRSFLGEFYGKYVRNPQVFLAQVKFNPRIAYVIGFVHPERSIELSQRTIELSDDSNLLNVLTEVRWSPGRQGKTVIVFREGRTRRIWLPHIYLHGHYKENIRILPNDVILILRDRGVKLLGEASNPGKFFPESKTPLSNFLLSTGGTKPTARLDCIHVFHADGSQESVNLVTAKNEEIPIIGDGDTVFIPRRRSIKIYPMGEMKWLKFAHNPYVGLRLSQYLAYRPPKQFGAAMDKTTVIRPGDDEAIKVDVSRLLGGCNDQPDPLIVPGTVVYIPQTRTAHFLCFLARVANIFHRPRIDRDSGYLGNRPNITNMRPKGPAPRELLEKPRKW